jgi:hypothetical protein
VAVLVKLHLTFLALIAVQWGAVALPALPAGWTCWRAACTHATQLIHKHC